jgi:hypothetical protein
MFLFFEPFCPLLAIKSAKGGNKKKFFTENFAMANAKFNADFESIDKKCNKVYAQHFRPKTFALSNYNQNLYFSVTFSLITLSYGFDGFEISIKFCVLFIYLVF